MEGQLGFQWRDSRDFNGGTVRISMEGQHGFQWRDSKDFNGGTV